LAAAVGGDVDPSGDAGIRQVEFTIVQPTSPAASVVVTEQQLLECGGWFLQPHSSPLTGVDTHTKVACWGTELDLTTLDEGELYVVATVTMKSGQQGNSSTLYIYNESQTNAGIRPYNRTVWLDAVNGDDANAGWSSSAPVATLAVAMDKARGGPAQLDASGCMIQVMSDLTDLTGPTQTFQTQGRWPLTLRSYNGRHKLDGGATWDFVGSGGVRLVLEGFDLVDGGIVINSGPDYRREIELVGCNVYPSWWGQNYTDIRALAEDWFPASTAVGSAFVGKAYHCQFFGAYFGTQQNHLFDCRLKGHVAEAHRCTSGDYLVLGCEFEAIDTTFGALDVTGDAFTALDIGLPGLTLLAYTSYTTGVDVDIAMQAAPLKGLTNLGLRISGGTMAGTYLVFDYGYAADGAPWVAVLATPTNSTFTDLQTCRMSDGVTWAAASTLKAVSMSVATTNGIVQDVLIKEGFTKGISATFGGTKASWWNIGVDSADVELSGAWTQSVFANMSIRGELTLPEGASTWTNTVIVDNVMSSSSGVWPSGVLDMANHWETGTSYGQEASTGTWFLAEGLGSVDGTLGTGKGWKEIPGVYRPVSRSLSAWVTS
jgi:hypothetical protein